MELLVLLVGGALFDLTPPEPVSRDLDGVFEEAPVPYWSRRLPGVRVMSFSHSELSRPVASPSSVFLGHAAANQLVQLSRSVGELEHTYSANAPVQSEALLQGDTLYFADGAGYTWCYRVGADKASWSHFGGAPIRTQPTLHQGVLYLSSVDDAVYALNATDGSFQWRYERPADPTRASELALFGAPAVVVNGDEVLAGFSDGALVGLDRATGDVRWERRIGEGRYPDIIATPLLVEQELYIGGFSEPMVSFDLKSRNVRWRLDVGSAAAPVRVGEDLIHAGSDGKLRAIDTLTGSILWTWDSETSGALSEPTVLDAGVLVSSSDGTMYLVSPDAGELIWEFDPGYIVDGITPAPLVVGRQLFAITNAGTLHSMLAPGTPLELETYGIGGDTPL